MKSEKLSIKICILAILAIFFHLTTSPLYGDKIKVEALTQPSKDVTLSFIYPGEISEIFVTEGECINKGQTIAQQDNRLSMLEVKELTLEYEKAKSRLKFIEQAAKKHAVSSLELERAKYEATLAEYKLEEAKVRLEKRTIKAPFSGKIEVISIEKGKIVSKDDDAIRLVDITPLWIDVPVPVDIAKKLTMKSQVSVKFDDSDVPVTGHIIHIASIADAGSETLLVRVEIENKELRPAGEHVTVFLQY